jgi:hypothetical protein
VPSVYHEYRCPSGVTYSVEVDWQENWYNDETDRELRQMWVHRDGPDRVEELEVSDDLFYTVDVEDKAAVRRWLEENNVIRLEDRDAHLARMRALLTP